MDIGYLSALLSLAILSAAAFLFQQKKLRKSEQQLHEQALLFAQQQSHLERFSELEEENRRLNDENKKLSAISAEVEFLKQAEEALQRRLSNKEDELELLRNELSEVSQHLSSTKMELDKEKQAAAEKLALLDEARQAMGNEFKVLANQIFDQKQQQFSQTSRDNISAVLKPMQAALDSFKDRVEKTHKEDLEGRAGLQEQLKQLQALNSQMSQEAQNLTQALKGDNKTQGNWGEMILERLLERSGLRQGIEFEREKSFTDESGRRLRPDVVLNLPDRKHVIIDSKVSLIHYEQALNSESEAKRQQAVKGHLQSLKQHIDALATKRYDHLDVLHAPDFVLMFIPVEGAYLLAIEADSRIFEDAFEKRVAVVTPTTLFTSLKTIEQLWRYERQSENTVKLIKRAAEVHDKFVGFIESFEKVGTQFDTAHKTYQKARNQLVSGHGNLVRQAEMLKELAGKTKKEIPEHLRQEDAMVDALEDKAE
ncbi:DNA recombination protein RmuC [Thiomicrorhabdus sp.]|uniref:DNA recombination protein RmuC n=1 Tax=Thiomicrorhabdus sp. TaxID=2039724 RepID=UPI0029C7AAAC|nr:DNA recombination protein RmuC [Thiomicrorhabdus sp.]